MAAALETRQREARRPAGAHRGRLGGEQPVAADRKQHARRHEQRRVHETQHGEERDHA